MVSLCAVRSKGYASAPVKRQSSSTRRESPPDGYARPSIAPLVNIELLLVQRWIRLHDDRLLRELFHLVQQFRVVGLQRFRNLRVHSQHHVAMLQMTRDLAHLNVNL